MGMGANGDSDAGYRSVSTRVCRSQSGIEDDSERWSDIRACKREAFSSSPDLVEAGLELCLDGEGSVLEAPGPKQIQGLSASACGFVGGRMIGVLVSMSVSVIALPCIRKHKKGYNQTSLLHILIDNPVNCIYTYLFLLLLNRLSSSSIPHLAHSILHISLLLIIALTQATPRITPLPNSRHTTLAQHVVCTSHDDSVDEVDIGQVVSSVTSTTWLRRTANSS